MEFRPPTPPLSREQVAAIGQVATIAGAQAGYALSRLLKVRLRITVPEVAGLRLDEIPELFGGMEAPAVGVLVPFQGDMEGNALLLFPEDGIRELERLLFGTREVTGEDLRLSAFSEVGNILTGTLLTVLSSLSEMIVITLPPLIVQDMAGALLDAVLAEVGTRSDEVVAMIFQLTDQAGSNLMKSVLIPGRTGLELFLEAAGRLSAGL